MMQRLIVLDSNDGNTYDTAWDLEGPTIVSVSSLAYKINMLFDPHILENGGILTTYFQVADWNDTPLNGIPIQLQTAFGNHYTTSERYLGLDGIIVVSFALSSHSGSSFEIYFPEQSYNGRPIVPPSPNPVTYALTPRASSLSFGTTHSCSASAVLEAGGAYEQQLTVKNDGTNILEFDSFDESKVHAGVKLTAFEAKLGAIHLESGITAKAGLCGGLEYHLSNPTDATQKQFMKNLITRWILTNIIALFPSGSIPKSLAETARWIIEWENYRLGIDNYNSMMELGGWRALSASAEIQLGIHSKHGSVKGLGPELYVGAGGDAELEAGINLYPDAIGVYGQMSFGVNIGAGVSLNLGFLSAESNVGLNTWGSVGAELIFESGWISSIELDFSIGIQEGTQPVLTFSGLAEPLEDLSFSPDQTKARTLRLHFSIPADKLTEDLIEYLDEIVYGTIDPDTLWQKFLQVVLETPVKYEVSMEYQDEISIPIGGTIAGIGFELGWKYTEQCEFTIEEGFFYGMQKWPMAIYEKPPELMDASSFILNNWLYDGDSPQPSGNVVRLHENEGKLYLHVYDSEGRHVGLNHQTNETEREIPNSYYFDNMNGTIVVVLPKDISNFNVTIDGQYAEEANETYNLTATRLTSASMNEASNSSIISKGFTRDYQVKISDDGEIVIIPEFPSFLILPLIMIATILTVIAYRRKL